jgi:hypothetical protein
MEVFFLLVAIACILTAVLAAIGTLGVLTENSVRTSMSSERR